MSGCSKRQKQKKQKTKPNPTHLVFCQGFHQWNEWVTAGDTAVCISIRETLVLVVLIVLYSATQTKVKHSLYLLWQSFYNSHLGTPHSLQKLTLSPSRKKKDSRCVDICCCFSEVKITFKPIEGRKPISSGLSLSAPLSWQIIHLFPFVCSIILFIFSYHLILSLLRFISFCRSRYPTLIVPDAGYFSSRTQSSCDGSTHLFCIRLPGEQTIVLTTAIKLMTIIKEPHQHYLRRWYK